MRIEYHRLHENNLARRRQLMWHSKVRTPNTQTQKPRSIVVGPQIGMNPIPILGCPDLEINLGSPRIDMGIPVPIWGPRFECRSNLGTSSVGPQIGTNSKPILVHDLTIPTPIRGSPFWYGDVLIPKSVRGSPNRFGDCL